MTPDGHLSLQKGMKIVGNSKYVFKYKKACFLLLSCLKKITAYSNLSFHFTYSS